jgi:hypothetical protein
MDVKVLSYRGHILGCCLTHKHYTRLQKACQGQTLLLSSPFNKLRIEKSFCEYSPLSVIKLSEISVSIRGEKEFGKVQF